MLKILMERCKPILTTKRPNEKDPKTRLKMYINNKHLKADQRKNCDYLNLLFSLSNIQVNSS